MSWKERGECASWTLGGLTPVPKTAEPIKIPFGRHTAVDPTKHVLDRGAY